MMLSNLVVYQLSASMSVVRGMNKAKSMGNSKLKNPDPNSQVFRQHQQSRLQRFDKLILTYVQYKQNEILINDASKLTGDQKDMDPEQTYKLNTQEINSILHLFNIFNKDQYLQFISQKLIKENLMKEFNKMMSKPHVPSDDSNTLDHLGHIHAIEVADAAESMLLLKFFRVMLKFLCHNVKFFLKVFDKLPKELLFGFYEELFKAIISEYRERLTNEFVTFKEDTKT